MSPTEPLGKVPFIIALFSNLGVHQNYLLGLLRGIYLGPIPRSESRAQAAAFLISSHGAHF